MRLDGEAGDDARRLLAALRVHLLQEVELPRLRPLAEHHLGRAPVRRDQAADQERLTSLARPEHADRHRPLGRGGELAGKHGMRPAGALQRLQPVAGQLRVGPEPVERAPRDLGQPPASGGKRLVLLAQGLPAHGLMQPRRAQDAGIQPVAAGRLLVHRHGLEADRDLATAFATLGIERLDNPEVLQRRFRVPVRLARSKPTVSGVFSRSIREGLAK